MRNDTTQEGDQSTSDATSGSVTDGSGPCRRAVLRRGAAAGLVALAGTGAVSAEPPRGPPTADRFEAGAANVDASPQPRHLDEGVYLGGFGLGPEREATGVHDGVPARALAVSAGDETVAFLSLNLVGFGNRQQTAIRRRVAARTDVQESNVVIGVSHSHSAPDFQGLWGGVPASYREYVVEQSVAAIEKALDRQVPARARVGSTQVGGHFEGDPGDDAFATNRRGWGFVDDTLTALQFRSGGETVATLFNYANHPAIADDRNTLVATDYVGPLTRAVEDSHGGIALHFNGAQGDVDPPGVNESRLDDAARYGRRVATKVDEALEDTTRLPPGLTTRQAAARVPIDNCLFRGAYDAGLLKPYYRVETVTGTATGLLGRFLPGGAEPPAEAAAGGLAINTTVSRVRLGDGGASLEALTVPGEALTRLGLWARERVASTETMLLGLTDDTLGYLVPRDEWLSGRHDRYEETVAAGRDAAPAFRSGVTSVTSGEGGSYERSAPEHRACPEGQAEVYNTQEDIENGQIGV